MKPAASSFGKGIANKTTAKEKAGGALRSPA
jgi:hypothetical protein